LLHQLFTILFSAFPNSAPASSVSGSRNNTLKKHYPISWRLNSSNGIMKARLLLTGVIATAISIAPLIIPVPALAQRYATILTQTAGSTVNVRSGAGTQYTIVGQLESGDRVEVGDSQQQNGYTWYSVARRDRSPLSGWVRSDFLKLEDTASSEPTNQPANQTVLAFQTANFAVRVFRWNSQLKMNVYDKKNQQQFINGGPVEVAPPRGSDDNWTSYVYRGEITIYARSNPNGNREFELVQTTGNRIVEAGY
jgi:uncharacterized protein YgiM (DUF1202 family)